MILADYLLMLAPLTSLAFLPFAFLFRKPWLAWLAAFLILPLSLYIGLWDGFHHIPLAFPVLLVAGGMLLRHQRHWWALAVFTAVPVLLGLVFFGLVSKDPVSRGAEASGPAVVENEAGYSVIQRRSGSGGD